MGRPVIGSGETRKDATPAIGRIGDIYLVKQRGARLKYDVTTVRRPTGRPRRAVKIGQLRTIRAVNPAMPDIRITHAIRFKHYLLCVRRKVWPSDKPTG